MQSILNIDTIGYSAVIVVCLSILWTVDSLVRRRKSNKEHHVHIRKSLVYTLVVVNFLCVWFVTTLVKPPNPTVESDHILEAHYQDGTLIGEIENPMVIESSGLAPSRRVKGRFWTHNDSGGDLRLYAMGTDGSHHGSADILGIPEDEESHDWEGLSSYVHNGKPYIVIGNIGNNRANKKTRWIYGVAEPDLDSNQHTTAAAAWAMQFRYEDGPRDSEAIAVDPISEEILLFGKRGEPSQLYSLPLPNVSHSDLSQIFTAQNVAQIQNVPQPTLLETVHHYPRGARRSFITGADVSEDGMRMVILTYAHVFVFERLAGQSWADTMQQLPRKKVLPDIKGFEAISFEPTALSFIVSRDGHKPRSPLYRFVPFDAQSR